MTEFAHGKEHTHVPPILVTGAAGRTGAVGRSITEFLLKQGTPAANGSRHKRRTPPKESS